MDPRYSSSRYTGTRPRSPTFNPARASLPTSIGYSSMYGGDIHVMPTSSRYAGTAGPRGHHHSHSNTPATTTTTYAVTKDPLARGASLREVSRNHRSSTLDSTSPRPVIVTTTQRAPQTSSSHHSSSNRHSSPTRDDYRSSDTTFYTQPASSIRSRSHHRGGSYSATMDNEEFTRLRERTLDPRHDPYRPSRSSTIYANSARHGSAPVDIGGDNYEYTTPSDLARYDLDHSRPPSRSRRRESMDRGYYRPSVNVTTTENVSRPYGETPRYEKRGPPPTTRGLDKINRSTSSVYDPAQTAIPPAVPAAPAHMPVPPSPKDRRSAGVPSSLDVAATSVAAGTVAGAAASRRPVSVYQEGAPRSIHHEDYYRSREDDRAQRHAREDRKYEPIYGSGDYFHDDAVATRGFGIRTDSAPVGGDFEDRRDPRRDIRSESRNGYRSESRTGYRTSPPDTKRGSDDEAKRRDEKERHARRTSTATEEEAERKRFRDKVSAGLGLAATAIGLGQAVNAKDKDERPERPEKLERESRRRSDEEDVGARPADRYKPRDESRDPRDRAPVIIETRRAPVEQDPETRDRDRDRDRDRERERERERDRDREWDRSRRDAESRPTEDSPPTSQRDGSPEDDAKKSKRPARQSIGFNPTDANDIRELKEQMAAMKEDKTKEKVPVPVERSDRMDRSERSERYERPEWSDRYDRFEREDKSDRQTYADLPIRDTKERTPSPKKESQPKRESPVSMPSTESAIVSTRDDSRGRETTPPRSEEKQVRVVSPPRDKSEAKPLKGILKTPSRFPEEDNPVREGVAPHKDDKKLKEVPPGARWTKISRKIVNPEALTVGKERFEVRDDFVIVLRVLSKEEIQAYAAATQVLRGM
ncbi:zinc finger protein [Colletotrichum sojae]|uniref:Zinc finger protein n=1 Tax=Colletotrichum sojae TaxID=2175907 RepID=A0A8H6ML00_9PEZI|nr:zinc finger protein [Colletotrichum sojae]